MKLEITLGVIVGMVFLGGGIFYYISTKDTVSEDTRSSGTIHNANDEKQENALLSGYREQKFLSYEEKKTKFSLANDISTPDGFINTRSTDSTGSPQASSHSSPNSRPSESRTGQAVPISISEFKGKKVVLLDIWTYSCINCIRTIPHLNEWHKKYEDQGLVIIGLHTPEFAFEKVQKNVEDAVKRFDIKYPVVLDNDFSTWNAYKNRYWPRKYLIDIDGFVVYDHIGEGGYEETEQAIQKALLERNTRLGVSVKAPVANSGPVGVIVTDAGQVRSHELYFGSARNDGLENGKQGVVGMQTLIIPTDLKPDQLYLGGTWSITPEYSESGEGGTVIAVKYKAKYVYFVANSANGAEAEVFVDGKKVGIVMIKGDMLYTVVDGADYKEHTLEIKIKKSGVKVFAFTFG